MAGAFGTSSDDDVISGINVTPLVDVVLVLLIIFMITAPVIYQSAIKVQLPQAKTGEQAEKSALEFTLTKDGLLTLNKEALTWETLPARLSPFKNHTPDQTAVINADKATSHGAVIKLIDALRTVGITRFALSTNSEVSPGNHP